MLHLRARLGRAHLARQLDFERRRQQWAKRQADLGQRLEQPRMRYHRAQAFAQHTLAQWARHRLIDHRAADIQQVVVVHSGRTGAFTVATGQAAIQVQLGLGGNFVTFEHLFDQVDAPTRAIQLVAEQLVGRAGGVAKTAMHARTQDTFGFFAARQTLGLFT
ncbi:hypothetical protein D9M68_853160 [compost metagenome]